MKRSSIAILILGAAVFAASAIALRAEASAPEKERAVVVFDQKVKLLDVFLYGQYLFIHDDEKMAEGQPCLYVYQQEKGKPDKLIVSFHCIPVARNKVDSFRVIVTNRNTPYDVNEIEEIQFAGAVKAHQVPLPGASH